MNVMERQANIGTEMSQQALLSAVHYAANNAGWDKEDYRVQTFPWVPALCQ